MKPIRKAIVAYQHYGLKSLVRLIFRFLSARLLLSAGQFLPGIRTPAALKIFSYQAGDRDSMAVLTAYLSVLNTSKASNGQITTLVPNYLLPIFNKIGVLLPKKVSFEQYSDTVSTHNYDILLIHRSMAIAIAPLLKQQRTNLKLVFENDSFLLATTSQQLSGEANTNALTAFIDALPAAATGQSNETIVTKHDFRFHVRPHTMDTGIIEEVYQEYIQWLMQQENHFRTIIDIGAHVGTFAVQATQLLTPDGHVLTFEPEPSNYQLLIRNLELNGLTQVSPYNQAVGNKPGTATLFISPDNTGGHRLNLPDPSARSSVDVEVTTLQLILAKTGSVDVLKVDVEGSEHSILMPFGDLLKSSVKYLIVEAGGSPRGDGMTLLKFLKNLGFSCDFQGDSSLMLIRAKNKHLLSH
ncbi:methyltransferase, FkbM family [Leptolyngbya sp. PCC 7375]|nr:methyltransferase, FkbM family [Leptolyngbya sp. PCC 7375]